MNYLIKIFILIFLYSNNISANEIKSNKISFKLNEKVFTYVDIEKRQKYISYINNTDTKNFNETDKKNILNDYISSLIFYEFSLLNDIEINSQDSKIDEFYDF